MIRIEALQQADGRTWLPIKGQPEFRDMAQARRWLAERNANHRTNVRYQFVKVA